MFFGQLLGYSGPSEQLKNESCDKQRASFFSFKIHVSAEMMRFVNQCSSLL